EHAVRMGQLLNEAKKIVQREQHGQWGDWLQAHCGLSERSAQVYMRIARYHRSNPQFSADSTIDNAIKALAKPKAKTETEQHAAAAREADEVDEIEIVEAADVTNRTRVDWLCVSAAIEIELEASSLRSKKERIEFYNRLREAIASLLEQESVRKGLTA